MSRYPPLSPQLLSGGQLDLHNHIHSTCSKTFGAGGSPPFIMEDKDGALVGPFPLLIHSPNPLIGVGMFDYIMHFTSHPLLTSSERELAILAVGAHTGSVYELYAHSLVAKKIGLSDAQIKAATDGNVPEGLSEREKGVFGFAMSLLERRGPLEKELFEKVAKEMGKDKALVLIQLIAAYSYVCLMLNAGAVGAPDGVEESLET